MSNMKVPPSLGFRDIISASKAFKRYEGILIIEFANSFTIGGLPFLDGVARQGRGEVRGAGNQGQWGRESSTFIMH